MGKYVVILDPVARTPVTSERRKTTEATFDRFGRCSRTLSVLEARCPDHVPAERWRQAVEDGRRFLAKWGAQAMALGWRSNDLFALSPVPAHIKPSFQRLSRYDETGLIWLLQGRAVVGLTASMAAIQNPRGSITCYRKHNKPAFGPA
jgi:hypothetical protein